MYSGLLKAADSVANLVKVIAELGLPPSRIVPPVDLIYIESVRIAMLYSQLQPTVVESERTITTKSESEKSVGLERKPVELKAGGTNGRTETQKFIRVAPATSQACLFLINDLLSRQSPPYYSTFAALSSFQLLNHVKQHLDLVHQLTQQQSIFFDASPVTVGAATLRQMTQIRQKTLAAEIEKGVRTQLGSVAGLVLVQGNFKRTSRHADAVQLEEQFENGPHPIFFRFALRDKEAARLLPDSATLLVLGDVIENWDGGTYLDFHPIAILSGTPASP